MRHVVGLLNKCHDNSYNCRIDWRNNNNFVPFLCFCPVKVGLDDHCSRPAIIIDSLIDADWKSLYKLNWFNNMAGRCFHFIRILI